MSLARFHQDFVDVHCHHILFGGSADNGYARLLAPHTKTTSITLLKGPPFAPELAKLVPQFRTTSFEDIFRSTKLPSRQVLSTVTPPKTPAPNYATAVRKPLPLSSSFVPPAMANGTTNAIKSNIARNTKGQRVDIPLRFSQLDIVSLKKQRLCNPYHILGNCNWGDCHHPHGARLTGPKLEALKHIARMSPCPNGLECQDEHCISGHRCMKVNCVIFLCRFGKEMHGVDTVIDKTM